MQSDSGFSVLSLLGRHIRILLAWVLLILVSTALYPQVSGWFHYVVEEFELEPETVSIAEKRRPLQPLAECEDAQNADLLPTRSVPVEKQVLHLGLHEKKLTLEVSTVFHRCSAEFADLRQTVQAAVDAQDNVTYLNMNSLQGVLVGHTEMNLSLPEIQPGSDNELVTVRARSELDTSEILQLNGGSPQVIVNIMEGRWRAKTAEVIITRDTNTLVWPLNMLPTQQSADKLVFSGNSGNLGMLQLVVNLPVAELSQGQDNENLNNPANPLPEIMRAAYGQIGWLQNLWLALSYAVPLLLVLLWARRPVMQAEDHLFADGAGHGFPHTSLMRFSCTGLLLISGLTLLSLGGDITRGIRDNFLGYFHSLWSVLLIWTTVFIGFIWPSLARMSLKGKVSRLPLWVAIPLGLLSIGLYVAAEWWIRENLPDDAYKLSATVSLFDPSGNDFDVIPAILLLLGSACAVLLWLSGEIAGALGAFRIVFKALTGWILVFLTFSLLERYWGSAWLRLWIIPFGWIFASISLEWIRSIWVSAKSWPDWLILVLGALFAVLLTMPPATVNKPSPSWLLTSAAWTLLGLWQFLILASVLHWLKNQEIRVAQRQLDVHVYGAAVVFMVIMFYWPARQPWIPLLVTLGVGLLMLRYWLFMSRPLRIPTDRNSSMLGQSIAEISFLNDLSLLRTRLRKNLLDKVGKGESNLREFLSKREDVEALIRNHETAGILARGRAALALNQGAGGSAWNRGVQGAVMAMIISIPWIVSYFWGLTGNTASMNAYVVSQLTAVLLGVGRWAALGFVFLYFYPHIRGYNGIQKGLVMTLGLVTPLLAGVILWKVQSADAWLNLLFWSLQVFVCCMTLGVLLGDIGALRRAGKGIRHLVEIYNFSTLLAWSSSVVIAAGAAVTTALATQVGSLFTSGLKLLLPDMPTPGG